MDNPCRYIFVCQHDSCRRSGSEAVLEAFRSAEVKAHVMASPCTGQCNVGPTVRIQPDQIWYCRVKLDDIADIVNNHINNHGEPIKRLLHPRYHPQFGYFS
ncbi:MAG: (2Fe-2S) ferredoxin domain-containing protein [Cyanobacteria bacterium P01_F01_bin.150]